ncbi:MAG: leucyl aminopeptidase [Betaproteobacteria bacterium]
MATQPDSSSVFQPAPSLAATTRIDVVRSVPAEAEAIGVAVATEGAVPRQLGLDRAALNAAGFEAKVGQALALPQKGAATLVAVGIGTPAQFDASALRDAAAAFARAAARHAHLATALAEASEIKPEVAAQAVVEGVLLARYRYEVLKGGAKEKPLRALSLVAGAERAEATERGAERGRALAEAGRLARDLANAPPAYLTAAHLADLAAALAAERGLEVEIFDKEALQALGCGGLLGVNAGSTEPPRMVKLTFTPKGGKPRGHLALVGKGIMYDSGGINIKPRDAMHALMKMDMSGAGAVLSAMTALPALGCKSKVTAYLMCTDNMPSGSATKMGDVLTQRGGKTVEINNTDAEGRLALADGLVLACELKPDAVINIGTLTGACLAALGDQIAGVFTNHDGLVTQVKAAAARTDESVWQLPLDKRYRKQLDSVVADMKNMGEAAPGAITAALYLAEFVGDTPWVHVDMCGTMKVDADESWRSRGATGYGARLLADLAVNFAPPKA